MLDLDQLRHSAAADYLLQSVTEHGERATRLFQQALNDELLAARHRPSDEHHVIVSGSDDQTVRIWDATTGHPIGEPLTGHTGWVTAVAQGRAALPRGTSPLLPLRVWRCGRRRFRTGGCDVQCRASLCSTRAG